MLLNKLYGHSFNTVWDDDHFCALSLPPPPPLSFSLSLALPPPTQLPSSVSVKRMAWTLVMLHRGQSTRSSQPWRYQDIIPM